MAKHRYCQNTFNERELVCLNVMNNKLTQLACAAKSPSLIASPSDKDSHGASKGKGTKIKAKISNSGFMDICKILPAHSMSLLLIL